MEIIQNNQTTPIQAHKNLSGPSTVGHVVLQSDNLIQTNTIINSSNIKTEEDPSEKFQPIKLEQECVMTNSVPEDSVEHVESPEINVAINNVVCTFSTRCHLNLKTIALNGDNVELKKAQGMLNMKLRKPSSTASIWSSGKITVTGASSENDAKIAARRIARKLQILGFNVKFSAFRVVNVLGTCSLPFGILLSDFSREYIGKVQYEPELHPGATYQIKEISATLKVFSTGSITVTAPRVEYIQKAVENVFPMVYQFRKPKQVDAKELKYIEELMDDSSEAELISDDSDLDLEPGELPSTKSNRFSNYSRAGAGKKSRGARQVAAYNSVLNSGQGKSHEDIYGSDEDDDDDADMDSDESLD